MADLTHLDGPALQRFVENDLADFIDALKAVRKDSAADDGGVRALRSIVNGATTPETLQQSQALSIGQMGTGDSLHGESLLTAATGAAQSVDAVFEQHVNLFGDIDRDLKQTIRTMLNTQGSTLQSIDAGRFLDVFSDVDEGMSENPGSDDTDSGSGNSGSSGNDD
ncbi:type VII secretion system-associated protein [Streptomyces sp. S3(2020)]|uniref:type VII secretion system-associated protein n=1 Tax=Streptomyces sp. S3(2020) TaxID=2732044 RepID=UPI001487AD53|nr:type VII secretion system-associated protein [Streptomyces sp. S3(2020)]NNN35647.1 type VII secretion system-associated protein [Streptomyces sp. S3(2020)]